MTILWVMDAYERMNEPQSRKEESMRLERDSIAEPTQAIAELRAEINNLRKQLSLMQEQLDNVEAVGVARYREMEKRVSRLEHPIPGPAGLESFEHYPLDQRYDGGRE